MAESKDKCAPRSIGRLLDYKEANPEEKVESFILRVQEQIAVVRFGIKNGDVRDPRKAENYIRKVEEFLSIDFFKYKKNRDKRVKHLKKYVKVLVATHKEIIAILKKWISQKRNLKIKAANELLNSKSEHSFSFITEMATFYEQDNALLGVFKADYEAEFILLNRIKGLLSDNLFMERINAWTVEKLKEELLDWSQDYNFKVEAELEDTFKLPWFRYKKYLRMNMEEFKDFLDVRTSALSKIIGWLDEQISANEHEFENLKSQSEAVYALDEFAYLYEYDKCFGVLSRALHEYEREYKLYRFGQGLMEADIFAVLYK